MEDTGRQPCTGHVKKGPRRMEKCGQRSLVPTVRLAQRHTFHDDGGRQGDGSGGRDHHARMIADDASSNDGGSVSEERKEVDVQKKRRAQARVLVVG